MLPLLSGYVWIELEMTWIECEAKIYFIKKVTGVEGDNKVADETEMRMLNLWWWHWADEEDIINARYPDLITMGAALDRG